MNKLPSGTYYIGDLCYVLPEQDYDDIVCSFQYNTGEVHNVNGYTFAFAGTAYGDGTYLDNKGNEYPVDAGIIGALRVDDHPDLLEYLIKNNQESSYWQHNLFTFDKEVIVDMEGGVFMIGDIVINTQYEEIEEDY